MRHSLVILIRENKVISCILLHREDAHNYLFFLFPFRNNQNCLSGFVAITRADFFYENPLMIFLRNLKRMTETSKIFWLKKRMESNFILTFVSQSIFLSCFPFNIKVSKILTSVKSLRNFRLFEIFNMYLIHNDFSKNVLPW